jgi:hypothetical protein
MATQRQGHARTLARTTPARLRLDSLSTAWYRKTHPTFADALALVRLHVWDPLHVSMSPQETDMSNIPRVLLERFTAALCYAA